MAHITGGGLIGNVPRVLPRDVDMVIEKKAWSVPPIFEHIQKKGNVDEKEMFKVFNMGIGMVVVVSAYYADSILAQFNKLGTPAVRIGEVVEGKGKLRLKG